MGCRRCEEALVLRPRDNRPQSTRQYLQGSLLHRRDPGLCRDGVQAASKGGVLAEEPLRGIRFHLCDAVLHSDCIDRGSGQIIPTARRAIHAAQLAASPRLMEPLYLAEIHVPNSAVPEVYSLLEKKEN